MSCYSFVSPLPSFSLCPSTYSFHSTAPSCFFRPRHTTQPPTRLPRVFPSSWNTHFHSASRSTSSRGPILDNNKRILTCSIRDIPEPHRRHSPSPSPSSSLSPSSSPSVNPSSASATSSPQTRLTSTNSFHFFSLRGLADLTSAILVFHAAAQLPLLANKAIEEGFVNINSDTALASVAQTIKRMQGEVGAVIVAAANATASSSQAEYPWWSLLVDTQGIHLVVGAALGIASLTSLRRDAVRIETERDGRIMKETSQVAEAFDSFLGSLDDVLLQNKKTRHAVTNDILNDVLSGKEEVETVVQWVDLFDLWDTYHVVDMFKQMASNGHEHVRVALVNRLAAQDLYPNNAIVALLRQLADDPSPNVAPIAKAALHSLQQQAHKHGASLALTFFSAPRIQRAQTRTPQEARHDSEEQPETDASHNHHDDDTSAHNLPPPSLSAWNDTRLSGLTTATAATAATAAYQQWSTDLEKAWANSFNQHPELAFRQQLERSWDLSCDSITNATTPMNPTATTPNQAMAYPPDDVNSQHSIFMSQLLFLQHSLRSFSSSLQIQKQSLTAFLVNSLTTLADASYTFLLKCLPDKENSIYPVLNPPKQVTKIHDPDLQSLFAVAYLSVLFQIWFDHQEIFRQIWFDNQEAVLNSSFADVTEALLPFRFLTLGWLVTVAGLTVYPHSEKAWAFLENPLSSIKNVLGREKNQ